MKIRSIAFYAICLAAIAYCFAHSHPKRHACKYLQDYQLQYYMDTVWIYDADRLVGRYIDTTFDTALDSIILEDNR